MTGHDVRPSVETELKSLLISDMSQKQIAYRMGRSSRWVSYCVTALRDFYGLQTTNGLVAVLAVEAYKSGRDAEGS